MESSWTVYLLGLVAQGLFSARMLVQWIASEKAGKVVSPTLFWILSLIASYIFFIYGWLREDFSLMLGQIIGYCAYIWNIGAKGVWRQIPEAPRITLKTLLVATPILCIGLLLRNPASVAASLFKNEALPMWMIIFGSTGQVIFSFRFLYQAVYSSKRGESILPKGFWLISLAGSIIIFTYGAMRLDPVVLLAQAFGIFTYTRNLIIWKKSHAQHKS